MRKLCNLKFYIRIVFPYILISIVTNGTLLAKNYYVSPNGSDSNNGSVNAPFKTIQKAANVVNPGDLVIVKDGVYTDTDNDGRIVDIRKGGTSNNWVIFKSENKWGAVLDGKDNSGISYGFSMMSNYIRIEDFKIKRCAKGGIWSNDKRHHVYIYGNNIHNIGQFDTNAQSSTIGRSGVYQGFGTSYHTYDSNIFHHIGRLPGSNPNEHHFCHDHGIYTRAAHNILIINNIFYENKAGWGIAIAEGQSGYPSHTINVINNTFFGPNPKRPGNGVLVKHNVSKVNINNNIFYEMNKGVMIIYRNPEEVYFRNNLIYPEMDIIPEFEGDWPRPEYRGTPDLVENNIIGRDPLLTNPEKYNFYIASDLSPALDAGYTNGAPNYDYDGNFRPQGNGYDIGAYEYGGTPSFKAIINANPASGPAPLTVQFSGSASGGMAPYNYNWDFGDNNSSNEQDPIYTFTQVGTFTTKLIVTDSDNKQAIASQIIVVKDTSNSELSIVDIKITEVNQIEDLGSITADNWYDLYVYLQDTQGWNNIKYADVWLGHESNNEGNISNRGGIHNATSNYIMSYSIGDGSIWAKEIEGSNSWSKISGHLGLYVDDDNNEYEQNSDEKWAKTRMKLLENLQPGYWTINAFVKDKDGNLSSLFQKNIIVSSTDSPPTATINLSDPSPTKAGNVQVTLTTSRIVTSLPSTLIFTESDKSKTIVNLNGTVPGNTFTGVFTVDNTVADGLGLFSLPADVLVDEYGNKGNEITYGDYVEIDKTSPSKPQNVRVIVNDP